MNDKSKVQPLIVEFPPELFIKICNLLSPAELFTLSQVCRKFREYLFAPDSSSTQLIWKQVRLQYMPDEVLPPPRGLSEEKYVELLMKEQGCQVCKRVKDCKIYWAFDIRCCSECFNKKTVRGERLVEINCPNEFIIIMPHITINRIKYYWVDQIDKTYRQYYSLSKKKSTDWLNDKRSRFSSKMRFARNQRFMSSDYWSSDHDSNEFWEDLSYNWMYLILFPPPPQPPPPPPLLPYSRQSSPSLSSIQLRPTPKTLLSYLINPHIRTFINTNKTYQSTTKQRNNDFDFIKVEKKKFSREFYDKSRKFNMKDMKGKNFKNKFTFTTK